jgi:molecular chaperone DnaK
MAGDNKSLGRFILDGIPSAPRGVPQIEVTFNIDANGILNVSAKDKGTSKEQSITISGSGNLDKADVEQMAKDAEQHADDDKKKRDAVEARNILDNTIYQAEKMKSDYGDKLADDDKKTLDESIEEAKKVTADADKEAIEAATKALNDKLMPIGAKMYESAKEDEAAEAGDDDQKDDKKKAKKDDKDGAVEGEVVDEK